MITLISIYASLGFLFNWLARGGGIESSVLAPFKESKFVKWLISWKAARIDENGDVSLSGGRYINAVAYGVAAWHSSGLAVVGACALIGMTWGQARGWGDIIRAMRGQSDKSQLHGFLMMTARGLFWGVALAFPLMMAFIIVESESIPHGGNFSGISLIAGLLQGVVYYGIILLFRAMPWKGNRILNDWTGAEMVHGALLWSALALLR